MENKQTIFFKAEANNQVGEGHLHRCILLADECMKAGFGVGFIFADSSISSIEKAIKLGYKIHIITKQHQLDSETYLEFVPKYSLILFDTDNPIFYTGELISNLRINNIKTACFTISDLNEISTDILINPNIISKTHTYLTPKTTKKLLGPKYLIFNKEYRAINTKKKTFNYPLNLLLFFGNADTHHLTRYFIRIIDSLGFYLRKVIIIVGSLNSDTEEINDFIKNIESVEISLHNNISTNRMIQLYKETDIAITSAGKSMWEMALFYIPQIVIASSTRETTYTDYISQLGYIHKLCNYTELPTSKMMGAKIINILESRKMETLKTKEFYSIINPDGVKEICCNFLEIIKHNN
ncbi:MAG: hypothetical protein KAT48_03625 [Bacteroidales bacterium]|nr:hypothetical protein [Bacteroidales bacterium]